MPIKRLLRPTSTSQARRALRRTAALTKSPVPLSQFARKAPRGDKKAILKQKIHSTIISSPFALAPGIDLDGSLQETLDTLGFGWSCVGPLSVDEHHDVQKIEYFAHDKAIAMPALSYAYPYKDALSYLTSQQSGSLPCFVVLRSLASNADNFVRDIDQLFVAMQDYSAAVIVDCSAAIDDLLDAALIDQLLHTLSVNKIRIPLFFQFHADMTRSVLDDILTVCENYNVAGFVVAAGSAEKKLLSEKAAAHFDTDTQRFFGLPLKNRAENMVKYLYQESQSRVSGTWFIIGRGSLLSPEDVYDMICYGASLVQLDTAFFYDGCSVLASFSSGLISLLERHGFLSLHDAIGSYHRSSYDAGRSAGTLAKEQEKKDALSDLGVDLSGPLHQDDR